MIRTTCVAVIAVDKSCSNVYLLPQCITLARTSSMLHIGAMSSLRTKLWSSFIVGTGTSSRLTYCISSERDYVVAMLVSEMADFRIED